jgi:hypothetical protein
VIGGIGCHLDISMIQPVVEETIKDYDEVSAMAIYSDNGFILAHFSPAKIGKKMYDVEISYGEYLNEAVAAVNADKEYECFTYSDVMKTSLQITIANIPYRGF